MAECPWYVSAAAVRKYMAIARRADFDNASDELIEYCARTWQAYEGSDRQPKITRTGLYEYVGPRPWRLALTVVMDRRPEGGPKPQLVDVRSKIYRPAGI